MREPTPQVRVVRASAGTGKTYALTTRYLALLRAGVDPATILATTFTRKAAGEVFERILVRLAYAVLDVNRRDELEAAFRRDGLLYAGADKLDAAACADMLSRLVARLDRAAIGTIDGFFSRLCNAFALEIALPVDPTLTDDGSSLAAELREAGIEAMLGEAADDGFAALLTLLRQLHHDTAKRSVTASLDHIFRGDADGLYATFRQARNSTAWRRLATPERLGVKELRELLATLAEAAPLLPKTKAGRTDARWAKALSNIVGQLHAQDWQALTNQGLIKAALENGKFAAKDIPADLAEPLTKSGRHAVAELIETLNRQHAATFELLNRFAGHFESRCVAQRVLLFADLTDRLAAHLRTNG
ncbi:MAG: UvrD-helicase domain-containing protein, partial [Planctomycetota bacterium]